MSYQIEIKLNTVSDFGQKAKELEKGMHDLEASAAKLNRQIAQGKTLADKFHSAMNKLAFVALPAAFFAMKDIIRTGMSFQDAMADLSALTGITGARLDSLGETARKMGKQYGLGITDIVGGMKRIASVKSEFIEIEGAIERVAQSAAVLSKASGMSFYDSGEFLTATMNQFGMGLEDTDRIINVLAETSRLGAFEISQLSQSMARSAPVLKKAGLSFEQAMATLGISSRLGLTSEMIGTQLKTGILRLVTVDDIFNPLVVGWDVALNAMEAAALSPAQSAQIFGAESIVVMDKLLENIDMLKDWTKQMKGTNRAFEQAITRMRTISTLTAQISAKFEDWKIKIFESDDLFKPLKSALLFVDEFAGQATLKVRLLSLALIGLGAILAGGLFLGGLIGLSKFFASLPISIAALATVPGFLKHIGAWMLGLKLLVRDFIKVFAFGSITSSKFAISAIPQLAAVVAGIMAVVNAFKNLGQVQSLITQYWVDGHFGKAIGIALKNVLLGFMDFIAELYGLFQFVENIFAHLEGRKSVNVKDWIKNEWRDILFSKEERDFINAMNADQQLQAMQAEYHKLMGTSMPQNLVDMQIQIITNEQTKAAIALKSSNGVNPRVQNVKRFNYYGSPMGTGLGLYYAQ